jgi:hypothetical protein
MKFDKFQTVIVVLTILLIASACKKDEKPDETPPIFSVTPVDISTVTSVIPFGADLTPSQKNPAFEYRVNNSTVQVRSVCKGYIERIMLNDNFPDYEVWIKTSTNSIWTIIYDHVLNLNISEKDNVNPGDALGVVGTGDRTELQINKIINKEELSYCPFDFGTGGFIQQHTTFTETWCLTDTVIP